MKILIAWFTILFLALCTTHTVNNYYVGPFALYSNNPTIPPKGYPTVELWNAHKYQGEFYYASTSVKVLLLVVSKHESRQEASESALFIRIMITVLILFSFIVACIWHYWKKRRSVVPT